MDYIRISISIPPDAGAARGGDARDDMSDNAGDIKDILIARLSEAGYEGFEEEEGAPGNGMEYLHAYIPEDRLDPGACCTGCYLPGN